MQSKSEEELAQIVTSRQEIDANYRDGGIFKLDMERYKEMFRLQTLANHLEQRQEELQKDLFQAEYQNQHDRQEIQS